MSSALTIRQNYYTYEKVMRDLRLGEQLADKQYKAELERIELQALAKGIEVRNVSFQYQNTSKPILSKISCCIEAGQTVAVVGPSGSGKSTFCDIILGLLEPTEGSVFIDGHPLEYIGNWSSLAAYVPQQIVVMDTSVRANVAFGDPDQERNDQAIWTALQKANLADVVACFEKGLDEPLGESGNRLSGGQKQRLGIARALFRNPKFVVFDEPTSALDIHAEEEITKTLAALGKEATLCIVAHRLHTIKNCDIVIFIKDGQLSAVGRFDDLQRQQKDFAEFVEKLDQQSRT